MRNARRISRGIGLMAALAGFVLVSGGAPAAWGQTFTETHKIIAADTEERDGFGHAVAISGNTAIVGAVLASPNTYMGSAYLFDAATGTELFKLSPNDAAPGDHFGYSVSISGDIAIVGARSGSAGDGSGAAYLFDAATGNELFKLTGSDTAPGDVFGHSVAIDGNLAIVGAIGHDSGGLSSAGSVYVFDVTTGTELFKFTAPDPGIESFFGYSVGISGNIAIVGAAQDDQGGLNAGAVYLFDVTTGDQLAKLIAPESAAGDFFGGAVAISGDKAIVGAGGYSDTGAAYLYDLSALTEVIQLTASDAMPFAAFGRSVGLSGNTAVVGAFRHGDPLGYSTYGSAYLFDATTGAELAQLGASDSELHDEFGNSVGISGSTAIVGAWKDDDAGFASGSAYVYASPIPSPAALPAGLGLAGLLWLRRRMKADRP